MESDALALLEALMAAPSPSGFEEPAQKVIREHLNRFADEVRTDVHGNVMGIKNPEAKFRVMLAGHCDEIGLMVTHIDDDGFAYFQTIGGHDNVVLVAQRVTVHGPKGPVSGVIGRKPVHLIEPDERKKVPKTSDLMIDIGARDKADALQAIQVSSPVTVDVPFRHLRNNLVTSRAFDDKVGAFAVAEALRRVSDEDLDIGVYAVATVQEELGLRGAQTAAFGIDPHVGIAVDVGFSSDIPGVDKKKVGDVKLGAGPVLHRGANMNRPLQDLIEQAARDERIPYQMQAEPRPTGTDARVMQVTRAGVATSLVSIPNRYMHTPVEVCSLTDIENTVALLSAALRRITSDSSFIP